MACDSCGAGTYQSAPASADCTACTNGRFLAAWVSDTSNDNIADCKDCQAGQFIATTAMQCLPCPAGKFKAASGANTACTKCTAGRYQATAKQAVCTACVQGRFVAEWASDASNDNIADCKDCPAGQYSATKAAGVCLNCPAGTFKLLAGINTACGSCGSGQYQSQVKQTKCTACANGKYLSSWTSDQSNDAAQDCKSCPAGQYHQTTASECLACPSGKYVASKCNMSRHLCLAGSTELPWLLSPQVNTKLQQARTRSATAVLPESTKMGHGNPTARHV